MIVGWHDQTKGEGGIADMHLINFGAQRWPPVVNKVQHSTLIESQVTNVPGDENGPGNDGTYLSFSFSRPHDTKDGHGHDFVIRSWEELGVFWATYKSASGVPVWTGTHLSKTLPNYDNKGTWKVTLDDSSKQVTCAAYCQVLMNGCGDAQEAEHQYKSEDECRYVCGKMTSQLNVWATRGTLGVLEGNNLGCRVSHALQAENAPDDAAKMRLCKYAGKTGGSVCGDPCDNWCDLFTAAGAPCSSGNFTIGGETLDATARSRAACKEKCRKASKRFESDTLPDFSDSMECRIRRAVAALPYRNVSDEPAAMATGQSQCYLAQWDACGVASNRIGFSPRNIAVKGPETSRDSHCTTACSDESALPTCDFYCKELMINCGGPRTQFRDFDECTQHCARDIDTGSLAVGKLSDVSGKTLGCKISRLQFAVSDVGCVDAKTGGDVCVDPPTTTRVPTRNWRPTDKPSKVPTRNWRPTEKPTATSSQTTNAPSNNTPDDGSKKGASTATIIAAITLALGAVAVVLYTRHRKVEAVRRLERLSGEDDRFFEMSIQ